MSREVVRVPPLTSWTESLHARPLFSFLFIYFLFYPQGELQLAFSVVDSYRATLNHVFSLAGVDLAASRVISSVFRSFERSCPPHQINPPDLNLSLVLQSLTCLSYELLKLSLSDKHLTWKTYFHFALALAKRVIELHGLSFWVRYSLFFLFLMTVLRNSPSRRWMTSWGMTRMSSCLALSKHFVNTWLRWNNSDLIFSVYSSLRPSRRKGCPKQHHLLAQIGHQPCLCICFW